MGKKKYPRVALPAVLNPPHLHLRQRLLFSVSCLPAQKGSSLCSDQTSSQPQAADWLKAASYRSRIGNGCRYQAATAAGDNWHRSRPSACGTAHSGWHTEKFGCSTSAGRLQLLVFESLPERPHLKKPDARGRYGNRGARIVRL